MFGTLYAHTLWPYTLSVIIIFGVVGIKSTLVNMTPTPENITFEWELISNSMPTEWIATLCDYTDCYTSIPTDGVMDPITTVDMGSGIEGYLKLTVNPGTTYGTGVVEFYVFDAADYNRGDTVSFTLTNLNTLTVSENELSVSVYPNPVAEVLFISNESKENMSFEMFDISGALVNNGTVNSEATRKLDVSEYAEGIYFINLTLPSGIRKTEKIVIK